MLSFGELKNLLKRFQDSNKTMSILSNIDYPRAVIDEKQIKIQPVQFYLRVIHYILIEYSPELYRLILDLAPNIKAMTDQKFAETVFGIARKIFSMTPVLTVDQFLMPGKWVEKKLQFVVELCEGVAKWEASLKKKSIKDTKGGNGANQLKNFMKEPEIISKYPQTKAMEQAYDSDDEQVLVQREITVKPTEFYQHNSFNKASNNAKSNPHQTLPRQNKPNVFPKNLKNQFVDDEEEEDSNQFIQTTKMHPKKIEENINASKNGIKQISAIQPPVAHKASEDSTEYISKQQFNEVLEMLASINGTVNGLVSKFNNFQSNVTAWFNNTNARIVLLEENVKMIKSNL